MMCTYFGFKLPTEIIPMRIDKFTSKLSKVGLVETYGLLHG